MTMAHTERYPLPAGPGRPRAGGPGSRFAAIWRVAAMAAILLSLAACWGLPGESRSPGGEQALQSNLSVASAALAAGQPAVAQRLYVALAERFEDAPEPALGLGYVALQGNNPGEARQHFLRAASLADDAPGMKAEALLGAARASLAQGDNLAARRHLTVARDLARDPSSIAWIENGLAVAAVFEEDYRTAEAHYVSALRQPSAHPRIAANFVRMLVASERVEEAERTFGAYAASWWEEKDRQALQSLIEEARRSPPVPHRLDPRLVLRLAQVEPLPAGMAERSGGSARPALYGRDAISPGLVLLAGNQSIPLAGPGRTGSSAPVQADRLSPERARREAADPAPAARESSPGSRRPDQVPAPALERRPSLRTAGSEADRSASRTFSVPPASHDILTLRIGSRTATSRRTPDAVEEAAAGSRPAAAADAGMGRGGIALPGTGGHGLRLLPVAGSSYAPDSSGLTEPEAVAVPAPVERTPEFEAAPAAGSGAPAATGHVWAHYLGPDPALSAKGLLLTAVSRDDSLPGLASSRLPSSPVALGPKPGAASATHGVAMVAAPETGQHVDATRTGNEARLGRSGLVPARTVNVAILDDHPNDDPFSAAPDSFRPILLASASPLLDDSLWQPEWMRPAGGTDARHTRVVAADGGEDPLTLTAEAGTGAPVPGGEWTVLLGTGQRLSLEAAAAAVAVASPGIADVQLLSPRVLFVMGRSLGRTTVSVLGEDGSAFERDVTVVLDLEPLRELLAGEPGLEGVRVESLARGVALAGDVHSQEAADRALGLAAASLPESVPVENNLVAGLDLLPLRTLLAGEPGLEGVEVRRVGRGVVLTGEVASAEAADRAHRLGAASLPAGLAVENNLRVVFDIEHLLAVLAAEPGLERVQVQRLARGVFLAGSVDSPEAAERALGLATASLPDGLLVESGLSVELDLEPLRAALAAEPGLHRVGARRLARGVALTGEVDSPELADRAFRMAAASLPEGIPVESNLNVELDLSPLRRFIAGEPGLGSVEVQRDGGGVALTGEVASMEAADRARRLAAASLPKDAPVENRLRVAFDIAPLHAALAEDSRLDRVHVQRLARSVVLVGDVDSPEAESRALRLAAASLPEGVPVENDLNVGPDLESLRALLAGEPGLAGVEVQRIGRGVALTGGVAWVEAAERARRLAAMSLPESVTVENNLRVVFDLAPLLAVLAAEPGLEQVQVQRLARGVALSGEVASAEAAGRALRLATASLPDGLLVENNLDVELSLFPLRALLAGEPGLHRVEVRRVGRGVALTGEVASADASDRAYRLAVASFPEGMPVENNLRVVADLELLREVIAGKPDLHGVRVQRVGRGVALSGEVPSADAADRAQRLAAATLPEGLPLENNLDIRLDLTPLRALLAGEPGLGGVVVRRAGRGVALTGEVPSAEAADRAYRLAVASLSEGTPVENGLRVLFDIEPMRAALAVEPGLEGVELQRLARGVALAGDVSSRETADRALRLANASLPAGVLVENNLNVGLDLEPLRAALAGEPGLHRVQARRLARGVALTGEVDSPEMADRAFRVATASLPEGVLVENNLNLQLDLSPLRALMAGEPGLEGVEVQRDGRGVVLAGEVASMEAADRAHRLAAVSLPEGAPVENHLRLVFDAAPLRAVLAEEPGLRRVHVQRLARSMVISGDVDSPEAENRALRLAAASLPEGVPIENELRVGPDLGSLRAVLAGEPGLAGVEVQRVGRGVALSGAVASLRASDRAYRFAVTSLPESLPVENNLRVVFDIDPLRALLAGEAGLDRVTVQRLARGVALRGDVDSQEAADRALRLAIASLPEGLLVEDNLDVGLDLAPTRALLADKPGLAGVLVQRVGRGVALTGEVASAEAADRAHRLAVASLPETVPVQNNLRVLFDLEPLRAVLAAEPGLEGVQVQRLARGVALSGDVDSHAAANRAHRLAAASLPEGLLVENNLSAGLDLGPLRALMAGEPGLEGVAVRRVGRGVALTGEVPSAEAADRAHRLAVASLPETVPVESNLRVLFDVEPLRALLAVKPGLDRVGVQRLARGVALSGTVDSPEAAARAVELAAASLPAGLLVENHLSVVLDLAPLQALMAGESGLEGIVVKRVGRGVALTGEVASAEAAARAHRLAAASLPESLPVESNLRVVFDIEPLRAVLAGEPELAGVRVQRLAGGVVLTGEAASAEASERAQRIAEAALPESVPVESSVRVVLDIEPLRAALALEPGLGRVRVQRLTRGVALSGDVDSPVAEDRALRLAASSLPEGVPVENNLNVGLDLGPLGSVVAGDPDLAGVRVERTGRGVALIGEVGSEEASEQAARLAAALLPEGVPVENGLRVVLDIGPLRALLAGAPELGRVEVQRLARGVALTGDVDSHAAAALALRLATASLPEGMLVESSLNVRLDLAPLRVLMAGEPELRNVRVKRVGRGIALTGEVGSADASERASRLSAASLPEGVPVENNLRVAPDVEPLRVLLAGEPGLERVQVQKLVRGVALAGDVASPEAADRALRLAAASLPEGMLVEDNLRVGLDLAPLRALMAAEVGFEAILVKRVDRGIALTGEVASQVGSERAARLAAATLPEGALVENNLRTVLDTGPLRATLAADPDFDGVRVRDLEHGVSLAGEVSSAAAAERAQRLAAVSLPPDTKVENELRIGGPLQVNLEVQIAEVQRSIAEDFGFNWELFGRSAEGDLGGGFRIGQQLPLPAAVVGVGGPGTIPPSVVDGLMSPSFILSRTWEEIGITGMVDALAKAGLANVLARPNVTANSGETASFFSGGEFPLPSGFKDGVIVFEYKKYGVVLDFVPTIVDEGRIELTVRPEVSEPSRDNSVQVTQGIDVPVINVRRAETTVAMGDGESIVIAGLFSSSSNEVQSGVPLLKDLPLVGGVFGHTSTRADELELIVTVTARLVQAGPAPDEALAAGSGQAVNSYYY